MLFSDALPETRLDLHFRLGRIPVRVHPLFWLMALLLGLTSGNIVQILVWVLAVFVSVLVHELGHALAMSLYGQGARILLYIGGGLTSPEPVRLGNRWVNVSLKPLQDILVSLAGPFAGFFFAFLVILGGKLAGGFVMVSHLLGFIPIFTVILPTSVGLVNNILSTLVWVNIFWGILNLMPVYPLDGGSIARQLFLMANSWNGLRRSLWLSFIAGCIITLVALVFLRSTYMALLFGFLALQSFMALRGPGSGLMG